MGGNKINVCKTVLIALGIWVLISAIIAANIKWTPPLYSTGDMLLVISLVMSVVGFFGGIIMTFAASCLYQFDSLKGRVVCRIGAVMALVSMGLMYINGLLVK